jgi:hypothetical protein
MPIMQSLASYRRKGQNSFYCGDFRDHSAAWSDNARAAEQKWDL